VGSRAAYDFKGGSQLALLVGLGLREHHKLCDLGCGSLRAGRFLIPYLGAGNYHGIEPRQWVLEAGLDVEVGSDMIDKRRPRFHDSDQFDLAWFGQPFDFVLAQSVFSHTYRDLARVGLKGTAEALAPDGTLVATFMEQMPVVLPRGRRDLPDEGSGFTSPQTVVYTWRDWKRMLDEAGLVGCRLRWYHQRQSWFLAGHRGSEARLKTMAGEVERRLFGRGRAAQAAHRVVARFSR
jgi:SAM-dependent methyltransferase